MVIFLVLQRSESKIGERADAKSQNEESWAPTPHSVKKRTIVRGFPRTMRKIKGQCWMGGDAKENKALGTGPR